MKTQIFILLAGWILLNMSHYLIAQEETSLVTGERVQVTSTLFNVNKIVGSVSTIERDFFLLKVENQPDPLNIPFSSITRLQISRGQKAKTITGGVIGLFIGAGVGALVGTTQKDDFGEVEEMAVPVYAGLGSLAGLVLGLAVGTAIHTEHWEELPLPLSGTKQKFLSIPDTMEVSGYETFHGSNCASHLDDGRVCTLASTKLFQGTATSRM